MAEGGVNGLQGLPLKRIETENGGAVGGPTDENGDKSSDKGSDNGGSNNRSKDMENDGDINRSKDMEKNGVNNRSNNNNGDNMENNGRQRRNLDDYRSYDGENFENNGRLRRNMDDYRSYDDGYYNKDNYPQNKDDRFKSSAFNNNSVLTDRDYRSNYNGYHRPLEDFFNRSNNYNSGPINKDDNNMSSTMHNFNRSNESEYAMGARSKHQNDPSRSNEQPRRLSIFEDLPRQRQYIYHDNPRHRQGHFEDTRYRSNDYYDRTRQEGRNTIPVPSLNEYSDFSTWEQCVLAWADTTELPKHKQGFVLANDLPNESEKYGNRLKDDFFRSVPAVTLTNNTNGIQKVLDFLKTRFYVDEEKEIFEVKRKMSSISRKPNQNINQFLIEFEKLREKSIQLGIEIRNDKLLALTLFECANLDVTEETVIRGVCQFMTDDG